MARFGPDVIRTMGSTGGILLLGTLISVITARALAVDDRGMYSLAFMISRTAVWFGGFQLAQSQIFHIGRRGISPERVLGASLPLLAVLAVALWGALHLAASWLLGTFDALEPEVLQIATVFAPLLLVGGALTQLFRAMNRLDEFNLIRPMAPLFQLAAFGWVAFRNGSVVDFALALAAAEAVYVVVVLWMILRAVRPDFRGARDIGLDLFRYGARLEAATAVGATEVRVAGFIVAYFTSVDQVAFWAIGKALADQLTTLPSVVSSVLHPKIAGGSDQQAAQMTAAACRGTIVLVGTLVAIVGLLAHPLVWALYGAAYLDAALVLSLLLPFAVAQSMGRVLTRYFVIGDYLRFLGILNTVTFLVNIGLLVLLVPRWGIIGAGIATSTAHGVRAAITCIAYQRVTGLPYRAFLIATGDDVRWIWNATGGPLMKRLRTNAS